MNAHWFPLAGICRYQYFSPDKILQGTYNRTAELANNDENYINLTGRGGGYKTSIIHHLPVTEWAHSNCTKTANPKTVTFIKTKNTDCKLFVHLEWYSYTFLVDVCLNSGSFFAKALLTGEHDEEEDEQLSFKKNDLLMVRDTGQDNMWEGTMLSMGNHGLVPVNGMQPLPYPFYQWVAIKAPYMIHLSNHSIDVTLHALAWSSHYLVETFGWMTRIVLTGSGCFKQ